MQIPLRYLGGGKLEAATPTAVQKLASRYNQGDVIACDLDKYRSHKQNNALHAACQKAFDNTPHEAPMRATVDKFFTDPTLKPYVDFYGEGKDTEKLTQEQHKHRYDMLIMAEDIVKGSQAHGRDITVEAAMESAHLLVSEPVREKAMRVELKAKVQKRAKGVTLKPARPKAAKSKTDGVMTEKQMEAKVAAGLNKVYRK